ncbi:zinc finger protein squeeze isoform X1 [Patella vulgata]|uniref:zinc finger protein squeeze isoform X1 n=1 Tax=Patella vulgata TaxID=6465 RepID=UPI0021806646|nr:zinc finger protein squeeze isoform X1 [Patella vulgata]XP_050412172.1 zinc finger protein squeeze isoform X1 [Patella vulgata]XP_050412173.1 zinc finger protein squeeze isoform X1 [Patella vulgata]XP_050412174.1 zinc finger protein squeeze isoform X1 [Patella vulgata]XP_050412176.1 zinc finger protein squeeze isoform X1 [Patella vulgata]
MIRDHAMFMYLNSLSRLHQPNQLIDVSSPHISKSMEELGEGDQDLPPLPPLPPPPVSTSQSQPQNDNGAQQNSLLPTSSRDKMHHCPTCLKPFRSKQQLSQHDLVHNGLRRHQCSYCDKCFKQLSHLQQHVRIHTGEKPYRCNVEGCERAFAQLSNLQHHLRNHDDQVKKASTKQFKCVICHRCYTNESSLKSHTLKMHIHIKPLDQQQVQDLANRQRKRKQKNPSMYNAPTMVPLRNRENGNQNDCVITRIDHNLDLRQVMRERQLSHNAQQVRENMSLTERQQNGQVHNSLFSNSTDHTAEDLNLIERRAQRELLLHEPLASASLQMFSNQSISRRPSSTIPTSMGSLGESSLVHQQSRDLYSPLPSHHIDHPTSPSPYPSLNLNVSSNPYPAHINHINRHLSPSTLTPAHQHYSAEINNSAMRLSHRLPHMMVNPMASNHMTLPTAPSRLLDTMPFSPLGN